MPGRETTREPFLGLGGAEGWMYWFWCQGSRGEGRMASQIIASLAGRVELSEG